MKVQPLRPCPPGAGTRKNPQPRLRVLEVRVLAEGEVPKARFPKESRPAVPFRLRMKPPVKKPGIDDRNEDGKHEA